MFFRKILLLNIFIVFFANTFSSALWSANDTLNIVKSDDLVVTAARTPMVYSDVSRIVNIIKFDEIRNISHFNIDDFLSLSSGIDLRERGAFGIQTDVSIRGGSFDQTLVLLNGIKISDPQTGHHSMDLTISSSDIDRIEVLEGPGARVLGTNSYSGAINIITKKPLHNSLSLNLAGGEYGLYNFAANGSFNINKFGNYFSIEKSGSKGFVDNTDFQNFNVDYLSTLKTKNIGNFEFFAGLNNKSFGANSFYSPLYPDEFEQTNSFFTYLKNSLMFSTININTSIYYRNHKDKFELFRNDAPTWYTGHNYHLTNIWGFEINSSLKTDLGISSVGFEFRNEKINSNVLGELTGDSIKVSGESNAFYTRFAERNSSNLFIEHFAKIKNFILSGGLFANYSNDYKFHSYGGVDISFKTSNFVYLFASVNQSLRLPTFTDLYYKDPAHQGNKNLKPENAISYEFGIKYLSTNLTTYFSLFDRVGSETIDWVRQNDTALWQSMNITTLDTKGVELSFAYYFDESTIIPIKYITFNYNYIFMDKSSGLYLSDYSLDYLKHKLVVNVQNTIADNLGLNWDIQYISRAGSYYDVVSKSDKPYSPYVLFNCRLFYNYQNVGFYIDGSNLFNTSYVEHSGVPTPGRWIKIGVNVNYNLNK
jgi:iron complex outermembrane receptor protein